MLPRLLFPLLLSALGACSQPVSTLEQVKKTGVLKVVTRNAATTYYEGAHGSTGLEYDLARMFANDLGVDLQLVVADNFPDILPMVVNRRVHLAAAGLTVTDARKEYIRFGPSYQMITEQLVRHPDSPSVESLADIDGRLEVIATSSHVERLGKVQQEYPDLQWVENTELESEELIYQVSENIIDYTIADSNEVAINRHYYPELRVALDISEPEPLAWAFPKNGDDSLYNAARDFFRRIRMDGTLEMLLDRYYGHVDDFDYVVSRSYFSHINSRLPKYRRLFIRSGHENRLDWRLLAAMGYQESHWNPRAVSPTGVRGIMMLTRDTTRQLGLDDRRDPEQSILGGGRYLSMIKERLPIRISEPDLTWMALAAYNVGYGHLEDARRLTETNGGNPDSWLDVKKHLPLLSQKKWYQQTRHGYARGREPVQYVENVRSYYDTLVWITERRQALETTHRPAPSPPLPVDGPFAPEPPDLPIEQLANQ